MQIIILSDTLGPTRTFHFNPRHALLATVVLIAALVWSGFLGFRIATDGGASVAITLGKAQQAPQIEQLALRVGALQAEMARLGSLGEQVARKTGVPMPDPTQAGRGGPLLESTPQVRSAAELAALLDRLTGEIELASDHLMVLDAELLLRQASQGKLPMDRPVAETAFLSSVFGIRTDPFTKRRARHEGLDFADDLGAPILAAENGVVLAVTSHPQYGNSVEIDHGNGLSTRYAHTSRVLVRQGDLVKRGQAIAEMGSTGRSTGPHLHFEVLKNGVQQNPLGYLSGRS